MRCKARIEEALGVFGVEVANQLDRAFQVGKQHGDLLALAFQGTAGGEDFLRQIGWGVGQGCLWRGRYGATGAAMRCHPSRPGPRPSSSTASACALDEFDFQIVQVRHRRAKLPLEGAIREARSCWSQLNDLSQRPLQRSQPSLLRIGSLFGVPLLRPIIPEPQRGL